jgi:hypothetical protein
VPRRLAVAAAALTVVFAACGSSTEVTSDSSGFGPLADLFGSQEDQLERGAKVEDAIRSCMVRLGWEYTPVDQSRWFESFDREDQERQIGEFGYGISTWIDRPNLAPVEQPYVDPNQKYVEKLSGREQTAYYEDLYGPSDQFAGEWDPMTAKGCQNEAQRGVGQALWMNQGFQADLSQAYSDIELDPRMDDARVKWSRCLRKAGFEYENQQLIYEDLQRRLDELMGNNNSGGDGFVADTAPSFSGDGTGEPGGPGYDKKKLAALQAEELEIAKADLECSKKHLDEVRKALEAEVVAELQARYPEAST